MAERLTAEELVALVRRVFAPGPEDRRLALLVDLPDAQAPDQPAWRERRELARSWAAMLADNAQDLGLEAVDLVLYRNVHTNNGDLPATAVVHEGGPLPADAEGLRGAPLSFDEVFRTYRILIAPTQFSATAPLKLAARAHGFRAATMPGFAASMIPALRLDYGLIGRRCDRFKKLLDDAVRCDLVFAVGDRRHELTLDLRHRTATASGGVFPNPGTAGNVPSGETYIVPYEGEAAGDPSGSRGELPVQLGDEVVVYRIEANRAREVLSQGPTSTAEARRLAEEPAYGNLAELGLGVLADFGLQPTGELLLDEKLGLHIAFGRSDHFGGQVGPQHFSAPGKVVHIDRVYTDSIQPKVLVARAVLTTSAGRPLELMRDGRYVVALDG
jgi:hypothetical protein